MSSTNVKVQVVRYKRHRKIGDPTSEEIFLLKRKPGSTRTHTIEDLAREMEGKSTLTVGDITHTMHELVEHLRVKLTEGDKVKIPGLGTFYTTFNTEATTEEKECTVRNIRRVNIRFKVDNRLRLVNTSTTSTRSANNVTFELCTMPEGTGSDGTNDGDGGDGGGGILG